VTVRGPLSGSGSFENDTWLLFHTDEDRSEAHDVAAQRPEKVEQLKALWYAEARKYDVLPLNSYPMTGPKVVEFFARQYHVATPKTGRYTYYPARPGSPSTRRPTRTWARSRSWPRSRSQGVTRAA
jgi:arylsulfatase